MTPAARVAAAIEVLDLILDGATPEKALSGWGRTHRFAGSKDRAAIRDHVFQALRCMASYAWLGGAKTGRGIMLGAMRDAALVDDVFTGIGHAPVPVVDDETGQRLETAPRADQCDMPEWLMPHFDDAFGAKADAVMAQLRSRAGVFLRVNAAKATRDEARDALAQDGILCAPLEDVKYGLQVVENERRISQSDAYFSGLVELQDPSSQVAIEALDITHKLRVLDYCAGGGGKALAMAALGADVTAHDIDPRRMVDIAPRAARAGVEVRVITSADLSHEAPFDLVLCDAPCSGSGTWRRTPMAKWDLTSDRLTQLTQMQDDVLEGAADHVAPQGRLAYATCSVFDVENAQRVKKFATTGWDVREVVSLAPETLHDGFYLASLSRSRQP